MAEILAALVAVDSRSIGKTEHDALLRLLVLQTASKMWTWEIDLVLD